MTKPAIKPVDGKGFPYGKAALIAGAAGAALATAIGLTKCSDDAPAPAAPPATTAKTPPAARADEPMTYMYRTVKDTPLQGPRAGEAATRILETGSCVVGVTGGDGKPSRNGDLLEVRVPSGDGSTAYPGFIDRKNLSNYGTVTPDGPKCTAKFLPNAAPPAYASAPAVQPSVETNGPVQLLKVSSVSARLYEDITSAALPAAKTGQGSCVKSTGLLSGAFMQVELRTSSTETRTFWAEKKDFSPAQYTAPANCYAKLSLNK